MKRKLQISTLTVLFMLCLTAVVYAQYPQYISVKSGNWDSLDTWEYKLNAGSTSATPTAKPGTGSHITIKNGHSVAITSSVNTAGIHIEEGAVLYAKGASSTTGVTLSIINTTDNVPENFIVNNGAIFSGNISPSIGHIRLQVQLKVKKFTLMGTGNTYLGRIYARGGNANQLEVVIDQDVILNESNPSAAFSAMDAIVSPNNQRTENDNVTFTINAGKKVELAAEAAISPFHHSSASNTIGGKYTYNINGILDFSKSTAISYFTPNTSDDALATINVSGKLILGEKFRASVSGTELVEKERVNVNVLGAGEIDITNTQTLTLGSVFFNLGENSAVLKSIASNETFQFPIGTNSFYIPCSIKNNSDFANTYKIGLKNLIDDPSVDLSKSVNQQWNIVQGNVGSYNVKFTWPEMNQGIDFSSTAKLLKKDISGSEWISLGTVVPEVDGDLQSYTVTNLSKGGVFVIGEGPIVTPLDLLIFEEVKNISNNLTKLRWVTANERNVSHFIIERSLDGITFSQLDQVMVKSGGGSKEYFFTDTKVEGMVYYRLKSIDNDGKISANKIIFTGKVSDGVNINIYPNPVSSKLIISAKGDKSIQSVKVLNTQGQLVFSQLLYGLDQRFEVDMTLYMPGVYVILVENIDGVRDSRRIIKL
ncbi:T9SS type A sorting domain-containing protein [Pseudopedobacter beijingensis]|uniref:T9SS type A sorting domain-containing protein n=1 Tax=Pseudopedobacter beijingensis TaxID=1207056 RepID=A0ABW4IH16_9SPHI